MLVGLQPTVIASRASPLHPPSSSKAKVDGRCTSTLCSRSRCGAREAMTVGCKPTKLKLIKAHQISSPHAPHHARMARRAQHLRCSLRERSERADNRLDKPAPFNESGLSSQQDCISLALRAPLRDATCPRRPVRISSRAHMRVMLA